MSAPDLTKPGEGWGSVHLVEHAPEAGTLEGLHVAELDASAINDKSDLMAALSKGLEFPDYFGNNWDALDECLRDLAWIGAAGYVLIIAGAADLWRREPELSALLVQVWADAAGVWSGKDVPFHLVLVH